MWREIEQISCKDDDDNNYTVVIIQKFQTIRGLGGSSEVGGVKDAKLLTGGKVNILDDEFHTFKIVDTDRIIRRVDR